MRQLISTETEIEKCSQTNEKQIPAGNSSARWVLEQLKAADKTQTLNLWPSAVVLWVWREEGFSPFTPLHRRHPLADVTSATSLQRRCHVGTSAHPLSSCLPLAAGHVERACVQLALASVSIGLQEVFVLEIKKTNVTFTQEIRDEAQPTPTNPQHTQSRWPTAAPPPRCDTPHTTLSRLERELISMLRLISPLFSAFLSKYI